MYVSIMIFHKLQMADIRAYRSCIRKGRREKDGETGKKAKDKEEIFT